MICKAVFEYDRLVRVLETTEEFSCGFEVNAEISHRNLSVDKIESNDFRSTSNNKSVISGSVEKVEKTVADHGSVRRKRDSSVNAISVDKSKGRSHDITANSRAVTSITDRD